MDTGGRGGVPRVHTRHKVLVIRIVFVLQLKAPLDLLSVGSQIQSWHKGINTRPRIVHFSDVCTTTQNIPFKLTDKMGYWI